MAQPLTYLKESASRTAHPHVHINLWIVARGINIGLNTRTYFVDEDNSADPVLALIEQAHRRETLLARKVGPGLYRFVIRPQGEGETVFLEV